MASQTHEGGTAQLITESKHLSHCVEHTREMHKTDKANAIRARIKQAMEGHVIPTCYFLYKFPGPCIAPGAFESCSLNITGPYKLSEASILAIPAYERK